MEAVSKIYIKLRYHFKLWRLNLDLKSVRKTLVLGLRVSRSTSELRCTKNFSLDNQFEVVEELICFPYSFNDKHLYCHDIQILISDNLVSYHVMFYTLR